MVQNFFNINFELDIQKIWLSIDECLCGNRVEYICVTDGNIIQKAYRDETYKKIVTGSMFSICDSSWVPLYLKWLYGMKVPQYSGSQIFHDSLTKRKYRMAFLGSRQAVLEALKNNITSKYDKRLSEMLYHELPFCDLEDYDYFSIANMLKEYSPDIIWVSLGAPKQEIFMSKLKPYLNRGVIIAVGAVFKFYSGISEKRAPQWMIRAHMEFLYRLFLSPKKQFARCWDILTALPFVYMDEWKKRNGMKRKGM